MQVSNAWIDLLELGRERLFHVPAIGTSFPPITSLPPSRQPHLNLGDIRLFDRSPVFDLARRGLVLRGTPPRQLWGGDGAAAPGAPAAPAVIQVPIERFRPRQPMVIARVEVSVGRGSAEVLVDTGSPDVLQITPLGLDRLGLPKEVEEWRQRGGIVMTSAGVGGVTSPAFLVQIESVTLGSVVYQRQWIVVILRGESRDYDGLLGCVAFLPFARVGLDSERFRLELELPMNQRPGTGGRVVIPPPGRFLGFHLHPGPQRNAGPGQTLPVITGVVPGSPAALAGLIEGDLLETVEDQPATGPLSPLFPRLWRRDGVPAFIDIRRAGGSRVSVVIP